MRTRAIGLEIVEERRSRDPERLGDDFSRDALGQHEASEDSYALYRRRRGSLLRAASLARFKKIF